MVCQEILTLWIEGTEPRETWDVIVPPGFEHTRTDGGVLAFFAGSQSEYGVSCGMWAERAWIHASVASASRMPNYGELVALKSKVFGPDRWAVQIFPEAGRHINIHHFCLHLWGPLDPTYRPLPEFGMGGSI